MIRKPSVTFSIIILAVVNLLLIGCNDKPLFIELHSTSSGSENTSSWNFSEATDYIYDPNKVEIVDGKAKLKQVDQIHSGADFNVGTHVGTCVDGSSIRLRTTLNCTGTLTEIDVRNILSSRQANLLGYFRFDSSLMNEVDSSFATGSPAYETGRFNNGLDTNSGSAITIGSLGGFPVGTSERTFMFWLNFSIDNAACKAIISQDITGTTGQQFNICLENKGISIAYVGHRAGYMVDSLATGKWHHVAVVVPSGATQTDDVVVYINGQSVSTIDIAGSAVALNTVDNNIQVEAADNLGDSSIDELSLWNIGLSESEVKSIYSKQYASFAESTELAPSWTPHYDKLVGYWKMDGNWLDSSGNGNHGEALNTASFDADSKIGSQSGVFDGDADYIDTGAVGLLDSSSNYSISLWAKVTTDHGVSTHGTIIDQKTGGIREALSYNIGEFKFGSYNAVWSGVSGAASLNTWHHIVATNVAGLKKLYINGIEASGTNNPYGSGSAQLLIGGNASVGNIDHAGLLDDVAIWNTELTLADVELIYNRQKQKYAGHYDSPVVDLGTSGSWTSLTAATALPFGKEIVAGASESSTDYSSLSGDLSENLVGYWNFNQDIISGAGSIKDLSSSSAHGTPSGDTLLTQGVLGKGVSFDGDGDSISLNVTGNISWSNNDPFTFSYWFLPDLTYDIPSADHATVMRIGNAAGYYLSNWLMDSAGGTPGELRYYSYNGSTVGGVAPSPVIQNNTWHHVVGVNDGVNKYLYINGKLVASGTRSDNTGNTVTSITIGNNFRGKMDEVAIWSKALMASDVEELYRRGANRIKYQVKSCVDSFCNCKSLNTAPVGNANDCDGDGIQNSADNDDIYKAEFVGPGGSGVTAFSELFNRDSGDMTFTCNANTTDSDNEICVDDEITFTGSPKASSPSFSFFDFPSSSRPIDNRYFQYRVLMEAEENTACDGEPCLPELTSVEIGPTGRYYSGSPSVENKTSQSLDKALESLKVTNSTGCNMSYQISNDGNNFYYWDGASWVTGSDVSKANDLVTLNNNITSFTEQLGFGDFFFRSYLGNSNFSECELDELQILKSSE